MDKTLFLTCECPSKEHIIRFDYQPFPNEPFEIYLSIHLDVIQPWWKRLIAAIAYVFGKKSRYGNWSENIIGSSKIKEIRLFLDNAEAHHQESLRD